ncbi:CoA transferase [Parapusillimonas granuli]|uniref:CoA transferase n=1 Tax=Parapusillimonas granuli TaxID=380911 RepID=A0A853FZ70_9BURK|nr:CoA transferase [Parapusillimonas granuli]MBB5214300.1 crotonobetainyl-CoA:carnitine CoA-transferase CaiB-like acyl-CoA transferase [Parapusillimonas granuli]MEB2399113.1 CoA transferase [Alcaligenaceae bacterium]NYT51404.1 CoA transferase [Parapusillimonas granuli]
MHPNESPHVADQPLAGCRVLERSRTVAAAYAGRLLSSMGAEVVMLEPPGGSRLRRAGPHVQETGESALFAYLAVGKRSLVCDPGGAEGRSLLARELSAADILIDDTPVALRGAEGLDPEAVGKINPAVVHVSVLPFGAAGPKAGWDAEEVNLLHAGGEGYLLPNGLSIELFPERPPLKIHGHFGSYQGGCMAALGALSAWWAVPEAGGQYVDVSVQDAVLAVGAFALQRLGDGSLEHRSGRSFRYGGVFETQDGYIELLTLEDRQWASLVELLGDPAWARDPELRDPLVRSARGGEINGHVRAWMARHRADDIVERAQQLGVPVAKYRPPGEVVNGEHERARGLFAQGTLQSGKTAAFLTAPFQFRRSPLAGGGRVPELDEMAQEIPL